MLPSALRPALIAACLALAAQAGQAADAEPGPQGIGFAQAEEGTWWCRGGNAVAALDCARDKCRAEGQGQDCFRTAWCYPAGWSGLMVVWLEDFHTTRVMCGAPSREALEAALRAFCEAEEAASHCDFFSAIDPEGEESEVGGDSWPGGGAGD
jgi:hypothetical protein